MKNLDQVFCICYLVLFEKNMRKIEIIALINFKSKINVINFIYLPKLRFQVQKTNMNAQKIDNFLLKSYDTMITIF